MTQTVDVTIAGVTLHVQTQDSPEAVFAAARLVQEQLDALKESGTIIDTKKTMVLVALNLANDLLSQSETLPQEMETLVSKLDQTVIQAEGLASVSLR